LAVLLRLDVLERDSTKLRLSNSTLVASNLDLMNHLEELSSQLGATLNIVQTLQTQVESLVTSSVDLAQQGNTNPPWKQMLELKLETMDAEVNFLKTQADTSGSIDSFSTLILNCQSIEDVEAWLKKGFAKEGGSRYPFHEDQDVEEFMAEDGIPTFGPFSNFFVVLCTAEDLENRATKRP
jgi:hypothetical protein